MVDCWARQILCAGPAAESRVAVFVGAARPKAARILHSETIFFRFLGARLSEWRAPSRRGAAGGPPFVPPSEAPHRTESLALFPRSSPTNSLRSYIISRPIGKRFAVWGNPGGNDERLSELGCAYSMTSTTSRVSGSTSTMRSPPMTNMRYCSIIGICAMRD